MFMYYYYNIVNIIFHCIISVKCILTEGLEQSKMGKMLALHMADVGSNANMWSLEPDKNDPKCRATSNPENCWMWPKTSNFKIKECFLCLCIIWSFHHWNRSWYNMGYCFLSYGLFLSCLYSFFKETYSRLSLLMPLLLEGTRWSRKKDIYINVIVISGWVFFWYDFILVISASTPWRNSFSFFTTFINYTFK